MNIDKFFSSIVHGIFRRILSVKENPDRDLNNPQKIIIIRQHNQLGDLLAGVSLFRAIKETYPESNVTLVVSPTNYPGLVKNKFIDRIFVFDKKKLINPEYFSSFSRLLKEEYDLAIVPVVVSISFTSNLIARLSNSKTRIGPRNLNGKVNESAYFFDKLVSLDWRKYPDSNVSERSLDIVRPFGITTSDFKSEIYFDEEDTGIAKSFLSSIGYNESHKLIGLHVGAGKCQNMWSLYKYVELIERLNDNFPAKFYLTGSKLDEEAISFIESKIKFKIGQFINQKIPEVAALIEMSDLFISNDTGIMHVAGTTSTPQVSIFGPTNPFNWAPIGENKYFVRKSEFIDDVEFDDVYGICEMILKENK
ncbi:MAG TPA: glycosyltransferase family 9 protein [Ignavibacteriaceae bacterium]|nr:glycosyltransferase family 9 protein [Ignavibacteriaceae bacterium]